MEFTRSLSVPTVVGKRLIHLTFSMAKSGFYDVTTMSAGHEIRKAKEYHDCWGADVRVGGLFWVAANAPACRGKIRPGDLYLVHPDRRDSSHETRSCMDCAVYFSISTMGGPGLSRYRKATKEDWQTAEREIQEMIDDLSREELPTIRNGVGRYNAI